MEQEQLFSLSKPCKIIQAIIEGVLSTLQFSLGAITYSRRPKMMRKLNIVGFNRRAIREKDDLRNISSYLYPGNSMGVGRWKDGPLARRKVREVVCPSSFAHFSLMIYFPMRVGLGRSLCPSHAGASVGQSIELLLKLNSKSSKFLTKYNPPPATDRKTGPG